jgi:hypothetical protein
MSIALASLKLAGLYESELLVELMLRYWQHPLADDPEFRENLLETAVGALKSAANGQQLMEDLPPGSTNFVAAIWCAEMMTINTDRSESAEAVRALRHEWLETVKHALPSCFCNPDLLS